MANKEINAYTAAVSIDGAADYLLIDPGGTGNYNKINRNTLLGVSGTPADLSTSQAFTNKTIGNTNTATIKDSLFTLQNGSDTTKQAVFSLSSITTGNKRTYTLPDITDTITTLTATQTLTNKTLTSPTINSPTITNASITADSVSGYTTSNTGTIYGMAVTTGAISSSSAIGAGIIQPAALVSGTGTSWAWQNYTPTLTNMSGATLNYASYTQIGKTVFFKMKYTFAGANITGNLSISLPVTASSNNDSHSCFGGGYGSISGGAFYKLDIAYNSTTTFILFASQVGSTYIDVSQVNATVPFTWASGSIFAIQGQYEAA